MAAPHPRFFLLIYRIQPRPTTHRVAVWRQLKKVGAVYLQQSICVFPERPAIRKELEPILRRIQEAGGDYHLLPLGQLAPDEEEKLVSEFRSQTAKHYEEIIEECVTTFEKEIEFEIFRQNFTYEEAEEIRADYEKLGAWFERVRMRDWFGAPKQKEAQEGLKRAEKLLEEFEGRVYEVQQGESTSRKPARRGGASRAEVSAAAAEG
jgi:hypothetical protein